MQLNVKIDWTKDVLLTIYIFWTLFFGISIKSWLGFESQEGVLGTIHWYSLPFLLGAYYLNRDCCKINNYEWGLIWIVLLTVIVARLIVGHSAQLGLLINLTIEPLLLLSILRGIGSRYQDKLLRLVVLFIIVESSIAVGEAVSGRLFFMHDIELMDGDYIRARSLHGHPLSNACLVCSCCAAILFSKKNVFLRYGLYLLGLLAIFAFNTRSSMVLMAAILVINIVYELKSKKKNFFVQIFVFILLGFFLFEVIKFANIHEMGARIFLGFSSEDGSANSRFQLINIVSEMPIKDLIFGITYMQQIINTHAGMATIENSFIILTFYAGLVFVIPYTVLLFLDLKTIKVESSIFWPWIIIFFLLLNANDALDGSVFSCRRLTPFRPFNLTFAYPYGKG